MIDPLFLRAQSAIEESRWLLHCRRIAKVALERERERLRLAVFESTIICSESKACVTREREREREIKSAFVGGFFVFECPLMGPRLPKPSTAARRSDLGYLLTRSPRPQAACMRLLRANSPMFRLPSIGTSSATLTSATARQTREI